MKLELYSKGECYKVVETQAPKILWGTMLRLIELDNADFTSAKDLSALSDVMYDLFPDLEPGEVENTDMSQMFLAFGEAIGAAYRKMNDAVGEIQAGIPTTPPQSPNSSSSSPTSFAPVTPSTPSP